MTNPHPGTVKSDRQAFRQIGARFRDEVGRIQARVNFVRGPVPFWSLLRVMFPVAESLGDLIYRQNNATAQNLWSVLENDFGQVRATYRGKAALLAQLYRHSLMHHDELRILKSGGRTIGWKVSSANDSNHLLVRRMRPDFLRIEFQPRAFYDDILNVCSRAGERRWNGEVMRRYNAWMALDLDSVNPSRSVKAAQKELASL